MKQLFTSLALLLCTAMPSVAQSLAHPYNYGVVVSAETIAECPGAMMGDLANHFNPTVVYDSDGEVDIYFSLLSLDDFKSSATEISEIKIGFYGAPEICFTSTRQPETGADMRMNIKLENPTFAQLWQLASHDIVSWTMDGKTIPVYTPTAGIFSALFKSLNIDGFDVNTYGISHAVPEKTNAGRYHLCLAVRKIEKDGSYSYPMFLNPDQWKKLKNKDDYYKWGIILNYGLDKCILVNYTDEYDKIGFPDYQTAFDIYQEKVPTKKQGDLIQNCAELRDMARLYGSDNYCNYYWTRTECPEPEDYNAYIFCPGIPDAPLDRSHKYEWTHASVLLIEEFEREVYDCYFAEYLQ